LGQSLGEGFEGPDAARCCVSDRTRQGDLCTSDRLGGCRIGSD
jgi:hypothetical protein